MPHCSSKPRELGIATGVGARQNARAALRLTLLPACSQETTKAQERAQSLSQVWNTLTGEELLTLEGHKNVVYAIAFNNPYGDKARAHAQLTPLS
eukprot:6196148-Pleurochrysis_carterae.AAC.3